MLLREHGDASSRLPTFLRIAHLASALATLSEEANSAAGSETTAASSSYSDAAVETERIQAHPACAMAEDAPYDILAV